MYLPQSLLTCCSCRYDRSWGKIKFIFRATNSLLFVLSQADRCKWLNALLQKRGPLSGIWSRPSYSRACNTKRRLGGRERLYNIGPFVQSLLTCCSCRYDRSWGKIKFIFRATNSLLFVLSQADRCKWLNALLQKRGPLAGIWSRPSYSRACNTKRRLGGRERLYNIGPFVLE